MPIPLIIKYQTHDNNYLLDVETNEILRVSELIYDIIECHHTLSRNAIVEKFRVRYEENRIDSALLAIESLSNKGLLVPKTSPTTPKIKGIFLNNRPYTFEAFLKTYSRMLTLELTHDCNLDCEYCCFGKHYPRHRKRGAETISKDIAELAIRHHLDMPESGRTITFYGGEPLLEFQLLRHCVLYAEKYCECKHYGKPSFSFTTNGTLLSSEILHFLVAHDFNIHISLDGDKESHDRYRVFREGRQGSFETIMKNIHKFVHLYPHYSKRGLMITLTASSNFFQINQLLKSLLPSYPTSIVNFVNDLDDASEPCTINKCDTPRCSKKYEEPLTSNFPDFSVWTNERLEMYKMCWSEFYKVLKNSGFINAQKEWPLIAKLFDTQFRSVYTRAVKPYHFHRVACCCIPGAVRLYCSTGGHYFPCEKVEFSESLKIGNVWSGIDSQKVERMINFMEEATDCINCVGKHLCVACPDYITESTPGVFSDTHIKKGCGRHFR